MFDNGFLSFQGCRTKPRGCRCQNLQISFRKSRLKITAISLFFCTSYFTFRWSRQAYRGFKMTGIVGLVGTDQSSRALGLLVFELRTKICFWPLGRGLKYSRTCIERSVYTFILLWLFIWIWVTNNFMNLLNGIAKCTANVRKQPFSNLTSAKKII